MQKLPEVELARSLMLEAMNWSVVKWLREKKRVRQTADEANAALDHLNQVIKEGWSEETRFAYEQLVGEVGKPAAGNTHQGEQGPGAIDPEVKAFATLVRKADEAAFRARVDAEKTFDEAERKLSTSLARDGCRKAIYSWDLHEKAIGKAYSQVHSRKPK